MHAHCGPTLRRIRVLVVGLVAAWAVVSGIWWNASSAVATTAHRCPNNAQLYPVRVHGKCGYINMLGKIVIPPRYQRAGPFSEDRAWAYLNGKAVLLAPNGRAILRSNFGAGLPFAEGVAPVGRGVRWAKFGPGPSDVLPLGGVWGYVDRAGKLVIGMKYASAAFFHEGGAVVTLHQGGARATATQSALIDTRGRYKIQPGSVRLQEGEALSEGLVVAGVRDRHRSFRWGYVDRSGRWVIRPRFRAADAFSEGLAAVQAAGTKDDLGPNGWGYHGFIDRSGAFVIPPRHRFGPAGPFSEGLAPVAMLGAHGRVRTGYINRKGRFVLKNVGLAASQFVHGHAIVSIGTSAREGMPSSRVIDRAGRPLLPGTYDSVRFWAGGVIQTTRSGQMEYWTASGRRFWPPPQTHKSRRPK